MRFLDSSRPIAMLLSALACILLLARPTSATEVHLDIHHDSYCGVWKQRYVLPHTARMEAPGANGCHNLPNIGGKSASIIWTKGIWAHCQFHKELNCQGKYTSIVNVGFDTRIYENNCKTNWAAQKSIKCYWYS